jgi:hypothetical protein
MTVVTRVALVLVHGTVWKTREIHHNVVHTAGCCCSASLHWAGDSRSSTPQTLICYHWWLVSVCMCVCVCVYARVCIGACTCHSALVEVKGYLLACFFCGGFWGLDSGWQALSWQEMLPAEPSPQSPVTSASLWTKWMLFNESTTGDVQYSLHP